MPVVSETVSLRPETLARVQEELRAREIDAWLLHDFHGSNPVASRLLGLPAMSRRYFVLLPAEGGPVAVTHRIEQQPWSTWIGENRVYLGWRELEAELRAVLAGRARIAMEYSPGDAVPYVDLVPAGVAEMVREAGVEIVTSAELVSVFYSRWTEEGAASHRRAAAALHGIVQGAFARIRERVRSGEPLSEWDLREWIRGEQARRGLDVGADAIVAVNANAANPHYAPSAESHAPIVAGDLVLIDLWGKESEEAVYADQTWMAYVGERVPDRLAAIFSAVADAREAAVALARARWEAGEPVRGWELDDAARHLIRDRGYAEHFLHRTGHSIDRELHGSGPNLDNLETRDTRLLLAGVGFSVEPGIYLPGDVGFRSEIDVYLGPDGPEVTTPDPQRVLPALLAAEAG